ncbi:polysaccharide pyruvyl transferase family protein [Ornithinimicrobium panacihumi]|uniref:polysaccharide pyruvyl transferase family protein n=1 Tax=Ornithinimicrobium panacihumi TaxID=2008449 RepID=UPI003F8AE452
MLGWDHALNRRARQVRRITTAAARASTTRLTRAFWWDGHPNFGDAMTPWLLSRHGMVPYLRPAEQADLIGVGSILEMVPTDSNAAVWGAGLMHEHPRQMPAAAFLAVRGPLTRDLLDLPGSTPLGDPAMLVSRFVARPRQRGGVAAVPHGHHAVWASTYDDLIARPGVNRVRFNQGVTTVVRQIAAADLVVSSSLHGLIVADAYGIPAVWAVPTDTDRHVADMKFADHHQAIGLTRPRFDLTPDTTVDELRAAATVADPDRVASAAQSVRAALLAWRDSR